MEERDEDMCAVIAARIGGIEDLPPRIEADADAVAADPSLASLAEQQAAHLRTRLAAVANLQEAIAHLAMSDFRGVAALEICGTPTLQRWEVIEPWCLIRPARRGPWLYNPTATPGAVTQEQTPTTWTEQHLPEVKDWKPIYQERNSPQEAIDEIRNPNGIDIKSADGNTIHINGSILDHWKNKTKAEVTARLSRWNMMKSILEHPHEVWINPETKQRTYLGRVIHTQGHEILAGFTLSESLELQTYFVPSNLNKLEKMRAGILVYTNHKQK